MYDPDFNPRSPYGERRAGYRLEFLESEFQSTLPVRGATPGPFRSGGTGPISIHAPRTGSDESKGLQGALDALFQSTLPVRGATAFLMALSMMAGFQSTLPVRGATEA